MGKGWRKRAEPPLGEKSGRWPAARAKSILLSAALAALVVGGLCVKARISGLGEAGAPPVLVHREIPIAGLKEGETLRVVQLTDLHASLPDVPPSYLRKLVARVNALHPDLIALTGDYYGGKVFPFRRSGSGKLDETIKILSALHAPLGVFVALGNHDSPRWIRWTVRRYGDMRLLVDSKTQAGPLRVIGLDSLRRRTQAVPPVIASLPDDGRPTLVLLHEPRQLTIAHHALADRLARPNVLVLAGHTHGGQVMLGPFNPFLWDLPCRRGLCTVYGARIHVSSGIGTSNIPVRFGVPPEIVLLTLSGTGEEQSATAK